MKVKAEGPFVSGMPITSRIQEAMVDAVKEITEKAKARAKEAYLRKKKETPKQPSLIIDSFEIEAKPLLGGARGILFAGGPRAPHFDFVNYPRKGFDGYFFMEEGVNHAKNFSFDIIKKSLEKHLGKR